MNIDDNHHAIGTFLNSIPAPAKASIMGFIIAVLRVIYDKEETRAIRVMTEGLICGLLSLTASYAIKALGLNENWIVFSGGVIGYLGSHMVRNIALWFLTRKINQNKD